MRNAFASEITELAAQDPRVVLLSGDIGNRLFDDFKERFPQRFLNCGVAEANMIGMAAGMALVGMRPVVYTITPFITTRCLEQIRDDLCYQGLPVVLIGVGGGLSYAELGATHHSCEDIGLLRMLPGMAIVCPGDAVEVRLAIRAALDRGSPVYIRLGKRGEPVVHTQDPDFVIGKGIVVRAGGHVCLLSTGNMLPTALAAAAELDKEGISAQVVSFHTIKPLDEKGVLAAAEKCGAIVTVEEHQIKGGLGGAVAEYLATAHPVPMEFIGVRDKFGESGLPHELIEHFGMGVSHIKAAVKKVHKRKK